MTRKEHGSRHDDSCCAFTCGYDYCIALVKALRIAPVRSIDRHGKDIWATWRLNAVRSSDLAQLHSLRLHTRNLQLTCQILQGHVSSPAYFIPSSGPSGQAASIQLTCPAENYGDLRLHALQFLENAPTCPVFRTSTADRLQPAPNLHFISARHSPELLHQRRCRRGRCFAASAIAGSPNTSNAMVT